MRDPLKPQSTSVSLHCKDMNRIILPILAILLDACGRKAPPTNDSYNSEAQFLMQRELTAENLMLNVQINVMGLSYGDLETIVALGRSRPLTKRVAERLRSMEVCLQSDEYRRLQTGEPDEALLRHI